jgi:hypothetical protein
MSDMHAHVSEAERTQLLSNFAESLHRIIIFSAAQPLLVHRPPHLYATMLTAAHTT